MGLSPYWSFHRWRKITEFKWDRSEKYFDNKIVKSFVDAIVSCEYNNMQKNKIAVRSAQDIRDYNFGYAQGRSVMLYPQ